MDLSFLSGLGGIVGGIGSVIAGNSANRTNLQIARETNQSQMDLAKYQADRNLDLWNLNNEYNSPSAQMERYKEAGVNPNLAFGSGSGSGNSSSPAVGFQAPNLQRAEVNNQYAVSAAQMMMSGLAQMADIDKKQAETELVRQNVLNAEQDNILKDLTAIRMRLENEKTEVGREFWWNEYQSKIANLDSSSVLNRANAEKSDAQRFALEAQRPFLTQMYQAELRSLNLGNVGKSIENRFKSDMMQAQIANYLASASLSDSQAEVNKAVLGIKNLLIQAGLNVEADEFDRLTYRNTLQGSGGLTGKAGMGVFNALVRAIGALK